MNESKKKEEPIKLVIMGMQNAGKTTIVNMITEETDRALSCTPIMKPTKNIDRCQLFHKNTVVWDFGGQKIYRNEYLKNPDVYFQTISFFYYVVDIQDYYRLHSSIMYFRAVFILIKKYSPDAKLIFLFHKMDSDYDSSKKNIKEQFLEDVEPFLQTHKVTFMTYDTTIFDLESIKTAFSQV